MAQTPAWNKLQSGAPVYQTNDGLGLSSYFTPAPRFGFGVTTVSSRIETGLTSFNPSNLAVHRGQLAANITMATKFSDLTEQDQNSIIDIEQYIQNQKSIMTNIESTHILNLHEYVNKITDESRALFQKMNTFKNELQTVHNQLNERSKDLEDQIPIVDIGKRIYEEASKGLSENILQLGDNEIDRYFSSLFRQGSEIENTDLAALNETLFCQYQSFITITGMVATLHEEIDNLRKEYSNFRRFPSCSNSFEVQKEQSLLIYKFSQIRFEGDLLR
ncbi:2742_t:CDS:2 [Funneliformis geosporum]|uniref:2742_t:CDS:1 n=1 Tax=Funneliformis geosporum TaxID=1117311 RepID=A0A9W4WU39_9GLOM|nr:2742_t:CDS:2 [Funneliformis geosporum]